MSKLVRIGIEVAAVLWALWALTDTIDTRERRARRAWPAGPVTTPPRVVPDHLEWRMRRLEHDRRMNQEVPPHLQRFVRRNHPSMQGR